MENMRYAGFWKRLGAMLIDVCILLIVIALPLTFIYGSTYWSGGQLYYGFWDIFFNYILPFIVTIWFWQKYLGTPGKMALKLRIVDAASGQKPTVGQSIGRYFAYLVSILPLFLGFAWIAVDTKKQGWHDKLAGTVVIIGQPDSRDSAQL